MSPKKNNNAPFLTTVVWIVIAILCIHGYFLVQQKGSKPTVKPSAKVSDKTAKKTVPPKPTPIKPQPEVKTPPVKRVEVQPPVAPVQAGKKIRLAIVIDDWGYNKSHCKYLAAINAPLGIAILPNLPYSRDIIQCALDNGKEPMLHLPLEPHNSSEAYEGEYLLKGNRSAAAIRNDLIKILKDMPGIAGVNNHTGSKGTEDTVVMSVVLTELKKRGLFFIDSVTTQKSVCASVASSMRFRIGRRDIFLDNRNDRAYIEQSFAMAVKVASRRGHALIIGHDRALTLQIIAEQVQKLQAQGYEFISVKDYVKRYDYSGH